MSKQLVCFNCLDNLLPPIEKEIEEAKQNKKSLEDQLSLFKKELEQEIPDDSDEDSMRAVENKLEEAKKESEKLSEELIKLQITLSELKKEENSY